MILPIFLFSFSVLTMNCPQKTCSDFLTEDALGKVETIKNDKDFQSFLTETLQQKEAVLKDSEFQNFVNQVPLQTIPQNKSGDLYIFLSFSMGEKALLNLAIDAKRYGATLVLRGFIDGSYAKTAKALQKIIIKTGQGFIIDPELFTLFAVNAVPTFILAKPFQVSITDRTQTPIHDRLQGHVSIRYALEVLAKEGSGQ